MHNEEFITQTELKQLFAKSADVIFQTYTFQKEKVLIVICEAMIDDATLNHLILPKLELFFDSVDTSEKSVLEQKISELPFPDMHTVTSSDEILTRVYSGSALIYFENIQKMFTSNIAKRPNRQPEETKLEVLVKGPRDNFIEDLATNIAIVRKRLPTNSLCVEKIVLGRRSKTSLAFLYLDDVVHQPILDNLKKRLKKVDVDIIFSLDALMEMVEKRPFLVPIHDYTGRPDQAIQFLARGRIVILMDGSAYGVITPINFSLLFKTGEDQEYPVIFSSFERALRVLSILIGALLPGFWLALTTFHQNQLPLQLLATVVVSSTGLPVPSVLEMFLMLLMFELFREAGLRLPSVIGGTVSVVGGLIIGDAAIKAGITSPTMLVVIAISTIAAFTLVNQSLVTAVSIVRFIFIITSGVLGLFGFFITLYFLLIYLMKIRVFGVPYMIFPTDLNFNTILKTFFRLSSRSYKERPFELQPSDKRRMKGEKDE